MDLSNLFASLNIDDRRSDIDKALDHDAFTRQPALWDRLKDEDATSRPNARVADSFMSLLPGPNGTPQTEGQLAASKPLADLFARGGDDPAATAMTTLKDLISKARPYVAYVAGKPGAFSSPPPAEEAPQQTPGALQSFIAMLKGNQ